MPPMSKQEQQMINAEYALKVALTDTQPHHYICYILTCGAKVQERSLESAINKSKKAETKEKKELLKVRF
jgi:hypothetical protein